MDFEQQEGPSKERVMGSLRDLLKEVESLDPGEATQRTRLMRIHAVVEDLLSPVIIGESEVEVGSVEKPADTVKRIPRVEELAAGYLEEVEAELEAIGSLREKTSASGRIEAAVRELGIATKAGEDFLRYYDLYPDKDKLVARYWLNDLNLALSDPAVDPEGDLKGLAALYRGLSTDQGAERMLDDPYTPHLQEEVGNKGYVAAMETALIKFLEWKIRKDQVQTPLVAFEYLKGGQYGTEGLPYQRLVNTVEAMQASIRKVYQGIGLSFHQTHLFERYDPALHNPLTIPLLMNGKDALYTNRIQELVAEGKVHINDVIEILYIGLSSNSSRRPDLNMKTKVVLFSDDLLEQR